MKPALFFYGENDRVIEVAVHEPPNPERQRIPERVLHWLWDNQRFDRSRLETHDGAPLKILDKGQANTDSGPDFQQARVEIEGTLWYGSIEMHLYSGHWLRHSHHTDPRYNSTILHVTLFSDAHTGLLKRADGTRVPELVLFPFLKESLRTLIYTNHTGATSSFACEAQWGSVPDRIKDPWITHLARHRINERKEDLEFAFLRTPHLTEVFYQKIFEGLGYAKNTAPMAELARRIPLSVARQINDPVSLQASYFGIAGLLPDKRVLPGLDPEERSYIASLHASFGQFMKTWKPALPNLSPMPASMWQFFRLRPANFPTLRIAQAAALIAKGQLFRNDPVDILKEVVRRENPLDECTRLFQELPGTFWDTHYQFLQPAGRRKRVIGSQRVQKLLINVIAPMLLMIAEQTHDPDLEHHTYRLLEHLPPERDHVTRSFRQAGCNPQNSLITQGLHQLHTSYCRRSRCLHCAIGKFILGTET